MKNIVILLFASLMIMSCTRQNTFEEPADIWNGYSKFLKTGEVYHTLWAGAGRSDTTKGVKVGTVTYGLKEVNGIGYFYVIYDCTSSGWKMSETHMYAGSKADMPLNKADSPKIGQFSNSSCHSPGVSTFEYRVPILSLPPVETGFTVATHCVVRSPAGRVETAWGYGDFKFNDKMWGWYDNYSYIPPAQPPFTVLYGTTYSQDSLRLYHLNMTTGKVTLLLKEFVENNSGTYDGAAYDEISGMFFFVNPDTRELFVNNVGDTDPSFSAGTVNGTANSGTFYNGVYYYVNADFKTINMVTFDSDWLILSETVLDTVPVNITVNDIAISPAGDYIYLVGEVDGGNTEMIKYSIAADVYYSISLNMNSGIQIAYGSDDILYAIAPIIEGGSSSIAFTVNTNTGVLTEIPEGHIIIVPDPFSDISAGPSM
jgi:hypothetical protein